MAIIEKKVKCLEGSQLVAQYDNDTDQGTVHCEKCPNRTSFKDVPQGSENAALHRALTVTITSCLGPKNL